MVLFLNNIQHTQYITNIYVGHHACELYKDTTSGLLFLIFQNDVSTHPVYSKLKFKKRFKRNEYFISNDNNEMHTLSRSLNRASAPTVSIFISTGSRNIPFCLIPFYRSSSFYVHFIIHFMFIAREKLKKCCLCFKHQPINQSMHK